MAAASDELICKFFQYGYCKFRTNCRNRHISEICRKVTCDMIQCILGIQRDANTFLRMVNANLWTLVLTYIAVAELPLVLKFMI